MKSIIKWIIFTGHIIVACWSKNSFGQYDDSIWFLTGLFIDECMEGFMSPEQAGICAAASSVNTYPGSSTKQGCTGSYQSFHPRNSQGFGHDPYVVINIDCPAWVHEYYGPQPEFHGSRQYVVMPHPIKYVAVIPHSVPPMLCEATVGNPIDTSNGTKIQKETDIKAGGVGQVGFERTYRHINRNSPGEWILDYRKALNIFEDELRGGVREKSLPYTSKSTACTSGWANVQPKLSDDWAQGAAASWNAEMDRCEIKKNNLVVTELPILPDPPILRLHIPGYVQLIREDGSRLNFHKTKDAGVFVNREGQEGFVKRISAPAQYWEYTDASGAVEAYDAKGKLIALTASNGMKQELFYDATSGLLSRVKDSTGRELVFSYAGNQISSVTVDGNKTTS